jgi:hypothetical protein
MWVLAVILEGLVEAANDARAILLALDFPPPLASQRIDTP